MTKCYFSISSSISWFFIYHFISLSLNFFYGFFYIINSNCNVLYSSASTIFCYKFSYWSIFCCRF